jgi:hypothetical protein
MDTSCIKELLGDGTDKGARIILQVKGATGRSMRLFHFLGSLSNVAWVSGDRGELIGYIKSVWDWKGGLCIVFDKKILDNWPEKKLNNLIKDCWEMENESEFEIEFI